MKNDNGKLKVRSKSTLDVDVNRRAGFWLPARPNGRSGRLGSEMQKSTFTFRSLYRQASERNGKIHFSVSERALPESFAFAYVASKLYPWFPKIFTLDTRS